MYPFYLQFYVFTVTFIFFSTSHLVFFLWFAVFMVITAELSLLFFLFVTLFQSFLSIYHINIFRNKKKDCH